MNRRFYFPFLIWLCGEVLLSSAASISITSIADTTLSGNWTNNNLGGLSFVNSGTTQNFTTNRGLFKFDVASSIPAHSKITSARLVLEVTKKPADGYNFADFGLHRLLQDWGEGNEVTPPGSHAGEGSLATTNEATWNYRFAFTTNIWALPGAAPTNDYVPSPSTMTTIYGLDDSPYTFNSTTQTVADVQLWLDNPETNFGWALICQSEQVDFTARRFGSREDPDKFPILQIDYLPPPQIVSVERQANQFQLVFAGEAGQSYIVEFRDSLLAAQNWTGLTNFGPLAATINIVVTDSFSASQRFYRVGLQ